MRATPALRRLARETVVHPHDLVLPLFIADTPGLAGPIDSLPGVLRYSASDAARVAEQASRAGLASVLLFGVTDRQGPDAAAADDDRNGVIEAISRIKSGGTDIPVIADVCLCAYSIDGACSLSGSSRAETLERHAAVATRYARAGADAVAPSGAFDGLTHSIRAALDSEGCAHTPIISYAVKLASALYGPFRDASRTKLGSGARNHHQIDPANAVEAVREAKQDCEEAADAIIVKPAGWQGDLIAALAKDIDRPVWAYQVSGEYAMIRSAAAAGWLDHQAAVLESLVALKRAGAHRIITYEALNAAMWLGEHR